MQTWKSRGKWGLLDPIQNSVCIGLEVSPVDEGFSHIEVSKIDTVEH